MKLSTLSKRLKGFPKVKNMESINGNDVPNQFIIEFDNGTIFQSYSSIIAIQINGETYLTSKWEYSMTTMKYCKMFLGTNAKETRQLIKSGSYKIAHLCQINKKKHTF